MRILVLGILLTVAVNYIASAMGHHHKKVEKKASEIRLE